MPLITPSILAAARIDNINADLAAFVRSQLAAAYATLHSTGNPQEVLDALGSNAVTALMRYSALYQALAAIGEAGDVPEPLTTIYVPNPDGTVTYTPAPEPTPEPQPEPEPTPEEPQPE